MSRSSGDFLGLPFAELSLDQAVAAVERLAGGERFAYIVTPNVDHVVKLNRDGGASAFRVAYDEAELILCDSRVLARLARLSGFSLSVVPGSDLTAALFERGRLAGHIVAIVGGGPTLPSALGALFPEPRYVQHRPPMNVLNDEAAMTEIVAFVAATRADVVLFAMGAPQSEIAAQRCRQAADTRGVGLCIGASLEFLTAHKRRAPRWMQRLGIEWAFRLLSEPRRLWRRYLVEGPPIFAIWWRWQRARR